MLQALLDYAAAQGIDAKPGFKPKTVRWLFTFSKDGRFLEVTDTSSGERGDRGRTFTQCPDLSQQEMVSVGGGCRHFLVDSLDVVSLHTKDGEVTDKLSTKHEYFVTLLEQAQEVLPILGQIAAQLRSNSTLQAMREALIQRKAKPTELATFAVVDAGEVSVLVDQTDWHDWWQQHRAAIVARRKSKSKGKKRGAKAATDSMSMRCFLSGELIDPAATHNKIEGLSDVGGLSMGDSLVSFDKGAFCSYELAQGANAAMSEAAVKRYVAALNHLIKTRSHRLAGVKVVYWYSGRVEGEDDVLAQVFDGMDFAATTEAAEHAEASASDRLRAERQAKRLLQAIRLGERPDLSDCRFFALTLSANSGRVVIRDWIEGQFEELAAAIDAWFEDLTIVSRDGKRTIDAHKFTAVLAAGVRELKDIASPMVTGLWRSVIQRRPIPRSIVAQTLQRVKIDLIQGESARHARFGLLKAFCNREERIPNMSATLNEYESDSAYLCGRIMAVLAAIQNRAMPNVGAGIVQRYYAAASTTPALVLGRLVRNAQIGHLPKIEQEGLRRWFERQLAELWAKLEQQPPKTLTLEGQTLFAMGYYQQLAKRGKPQNESTSNSEDRNESSAEG